MKVNKRLIFTIAAVGGTVATAVLSAIGGTKAERILAANDGLNGSKDSNCMTLWEKAKAVWFVYIPAGLVTGVTIAMIVLGHEEGTTAIAAAGAAAVAIKNRFDKYREAAKEAGVDADLVVKASKPKVSDDILDYEARHTFCIDWLENTEPIYFETTLGEYLSAMATINRQLVDLTVGDGLATVSDFLSAVGCSDLITERTDKAGWQADVLAIECDAYWIDSWLDKRPGEDIYDVRLAWYPNYDLQQAIDEMEGEGLL